MTKTVKYPRTPHLPWSPGATNDDRMLEDVSCFQGKHVVVSLKMDGENTTLYREHLHARSLDSKDHPARHWMKGLWAQKRYFIPEGWRVCGENLYAKHSIYYDDLESFFLVFSIWDGDTCLPYWKTRTLCDEWGFAHVPPMYNGFWLEPEQNSGNDMETFLGRRFENMYLGHEGYVIRNYDEFQLEHFDRNVAKYVRKDHVQTDEHWMHKKVVPNKLYASS